MISQADFQIAVGMQRQRFSQEAQNAALIEELRNGRMLKETMQECRERAASLEAQQMKGHKTIAGLGKAVAVLPAHEFFLMREKYGEEAFADKGFVRDMQRHEPHLAVHKI